MARPCKHTPELAAALVKALKKGHWRETACASVGISTRTLLNWLRRGDDGEAPFVDFALAVRIAESEPETAAVDLITGHSRDDWRAASWWLERRFPQRWGERVRIEVKQELDKILDIAEAVLPRDQFANLLNALDSGSAPASPAEHDEQRTDH